MVQPRLYLLDVILDKQAIITIKRKIIEKNKKNKTQAYKNFIIFKSKKTK